MSAGGEFGSRFECGYPSTAPALGDEPFATAVAVLWGTTLPFVQKSDSAGGLHHSTRAMNSAGAIPSAISQSCVSTTSTLRSRFSTLARNNRP